MNNNQTFNLFLFALVLLPIPMAMAETTSDDEHIRQIVNELLEEKNSKIKTLEERVLQLENNQQIQPGRQAKNLICTVNDNQKKDEKPSGFSEKLVELEEQVENLKATAEDNGLEITGFFDFSARTENRAENTFSLGAVEIDLEYAYNEHFAASSGLGWRYC